MFPAFRGVSRLPPTSSAFRDENLASPPFRTVNQVKPCGALPAGMAIPDITLLVCEA